MVESALLQEVERNDMSDQKRIALADQLADLAMDFQRRAIRLSKLAREVRMGNAIYKVANPESKGAARCLKKLRK